ncbi:MAG TPA: hypothetical protein VJZ71_20400 [Phycisphaerae bacterium]|nr:hypothetical protein [Phycisphaerae bacterium]
MRDFDEMKLARVIDACGGVDGRVKMQKIVYLLKAMGYGLPFDDFRIRQLGPFSRAVACSTDTLKAAGFVEERLTVLPGPGGQPLEQFSYKVSDSIKPLLKKHFDIPKPSGKPKIETAAVELRGHDRAVLEVAATKVFLQREDKLKGDTLVAELKRLKGHLANRFCEADAMITDMTKKGWL